MYDQDQIVENYSRLRNDFKFQKSMSILILTEAVLNNNQNSTIIEHAVNTIRKDFTKDWVKQMIKLICTDPELRIMF